MSESHAANTTSSRTFKWGGFEFEEYTSIDAEWREVGGLFLFVLIDLPHKGVIKRCVLYVEATPNFASSIPNHPMLPKARRHAADRHRTRARQLRMAEMIWVHARVVEHAQLRHELEDSLLDNLRPLLNFQ